PCPAVARRRRTCRAEVGRRRIVLVIDRGEAGRKNLSGPSVSKRVQACPRSGVQTSPNRTPTEGNEGNKGRGKPALEPVRTTFPCPNPIFVPFVCFCSKKTARFTANPRSSPLIKLEWTRIPNRIPTEGNKGRTKPAPKSVRGIFLCLNSPLGAFVPWL